MQRDQAQAIAAEAPAAANSIALRGDESAASAIAPAPCASSTRPGASSSTNWMQTRFDQLKTSMKKQFAPQLNELKTKLSTSATVSRDRIRSSGEQLQPALTKARVGVTGLTRQVSRTSAQMQHHVGALGTRLVQDLFVSKKGAVDVDGSAQLVMNCPSSPTYFLAAARDLVGYYVTGSSDNPRDPPSPAALCMDIPHILYTVVAFTGCTATYTRLSSVNRGMRHHLLAEPRLKRYCVRVNGMSPSLRVPFWQHISGAHAIQATCSAGYTSYRDDAQLKNEWTAAIDIDVRRTYGRVVVVQPSTSDDLLDAASDLGHTDVDIQNQLTGVLHALASRYPVVGYCQGMDYIAAHVLEHVIAHHSHSKRQVEPTPSKAQLLAVEEEASFWLLVALFDNYELEAMFSPGLEKLHLHCFQFNRAFELGLPALHAHFDSECISTEMYLVGWFQTLFLYLNVLPKPTIDAVWDVFLYERTWKIMFRAALAMLAMCETFLLSQPIDVTSRFLNTFAGHLHVLEPTVLVPSALRIKLTNAVLRGLCDIKEDKSLSLA